MEWISVKEKLPENGVIVQVLNGRGRVVTNLKRQNRLWFLPDGSMYVYYEPTHWMPLPPDKGFDMKTDVNTERLDDVSNMTRNDVVPYYVHTIHFADKEEILRVNNLILSKWTSSGLLYIKDKAWKIVNERSN